MSQENVETARRMLDAWNRRDMETLRALSHPEIEFVNSPTAVEPGTRRGEDEVEAATRAQWEMLLDARQEIDRTYDRGDEIIVLGRLSRRMPESEARLEQRVLTAWTIRDGKVSRTQVLGFGTTEVQEALEAVGLSEQDAHADS
jgi:ketosteroid isomerase-like protein